MTHEVSDTFQRDTVGAVPMSRYRRYEDILSQDYVHVHTLQLVLAHALPPHFTKDTLMNLALMTSEGENRYGLEGVLMQPRFEMVWGLA